jgi:hypothetical protein
MVSKNNTHKNFVLSFQYMNAFIQIPLNGLTLTTEKTLEKKNLFDRLQSHG